MFNLSALCFPQNYPDPGRRGKYCVGSKNREGETFKEGAASNSASAFASSLTSLGGSERSLCDSHPHSDLQPPGAIYERMEWGVGRKRN